MKRFLSFFMSLMVLSLSFAHANENSKKKAIILVPGITSCGLFHVGETNSKYYKNEALWINIYDSKKRAAKAAYKFIRYHKDLRCDDNGDPINKDVGIYKEGTFPYKSDKKIQKYGVQYTYKKILKAMDKKIGVNTKYGYDVILYNYDWRLDANKNAKLLSDKVEKYDEVILIGYSLGGLISSKCAVNLLGKNQLDKIKLFISVGVPYNGSVNSVETLENGFELCPNISKIQNLVKSIASNYPALYQLFPTEKFFEKNSKGYIIDNKDSTLNYEKTNQVLNKMPWYKKSNGENKNFLKSAEAFHKSLFVNGKHITDYLNTYFIVGTGVKTPIELKVTDKKTVISKFDDGDGMVPLKASAMSPVDENKDKILKVASQHNKILSNDKVIATIINTISNFK